MRCGCAGRRWHPQSAIWLWCTWKEWWCKDRLFVRRRGHSCIHSGGLRQERERQSFRRRTQRFEQTGRRRGEGLSEAKVTKAAFEKIKAGLEEAKAYVDGSGDKTRYRIHVPTRVNVKKIRARLGLSQESFAQTYGFALSAVRDWEQGRRQPERSARILLKVVEKEPEAVLRALAKSA